MKNVASVQEVICEQWMRPTIATINKGPIPRGRYVINPTEIVNPSLWGDLRRNFRTPPSAGGGDWGDWRVRIYPARGTPRYGRTGFYLHGGYFDGAKAFRRHDGFTSIGRRRTPNQNCACDVDFGLTNKDLL
jgi:hypothetical protein